ncbi:serine O-acetyltransferase [Methylomarinum vadi]|uniref:serine O-acetyltransferase n=1 Tax=Methylomarinum vadi TaxID=438855 RepID=UPI0004DF6153|nr:serine O-acetyltransferase [Methylomarinum vadi]
MFKRIQEEINCVFDRDPAAQSVFEVITAYPGFHAMIIHRLSHYFWQSGYRWLGRFSSHIGRWLTGIEIHPGATIGRRFFIDHGMGVVIGETAVIGDDCTLYHGVTLGGTSWNKGKRHPTLRNGVVIGAGAKVLGPIEIGEGARVGSNSVVVKPVPAGATVVGIPAHIIDRKSKQKAANRDAIAQKMGFDAYGATADMPDPIANAINHMLDHIHAMDKQLESLKQVLNEAGIEFKNQAIPELNHCEIKDNE